MEEFFYEVRDAVTGNLLKGCFKAENKADVVAYLKQEQYLIISINHHDFVSFKQKLRRKLQHKRLGSAQIILLCRQLAIMLQAGIGIMEALTVLERNTPHKQLRKFLAETARQLKEGASLTEIWQSKTDFIPPELLNALNIAENTGMLPTALNQSADFLEKNYAQKQKIKQICIYPACLLALLLVIVNIMILFVLPTFADIFQRMNLTLPLITQLIFSAGLFIKDNYTAILLVGIMAVIILRGLWQKEDLQRRFYECILKIPCLGGFCCNLYLVQINRQLEFLIGSGIDIDESIAVILAGMNNAYWRKILQTVQSGLRQGFSLYTAFGNAGLSNTIFAELINVGEQTGMLLQTLHYSSMFLSRETDNFINEFTKLLEPVLMMVVGLIVGAFVMAIVLPLFEMSSSIGL